MYGSECRLTCHDGYTMVGSSKRVCEKNRESSAVLWTGNDTRCEGMYIRTPAQSWFGSRKVELLLVKNQVYLRCMMFIMTAYTKNEGEKT